MDFESEDPYVRAAHIFAMRREPHEDDFLLFKSLDGLDGLFLDVGANIGQSAMSIFFVNSSLRVFSLEPNFRLSAALELVKSMYPDRFSFRIAGAADRTRNGLLNVPVSGAFDLSPNSSFDPLEFQKDYVKNRLSGGQECDGTSKSYSVDIIEAPLVTIDELELEPTVIKIDVEGFELPALQGASDTIQRLHPILMIENNNFFGFARLLRTWGYQLHHFSASQNRIVAIDWRNPEWALNHFWLHSEMRTDVARRIAPLLSTFNKSQ
jgi:FkbM family methyltransferase